MSMRDAQHFVILLSKICVVFITVFVEKVILIDFDLKENYKKG